ncbi:MAG: thiamine phosphate synthase [Hyphomicrobiaceae bacterium]|nr:thiamine phosphate synthase [Hyphomicrobiaceae bacterium]
MSANDLSKLYLVLDAGPQAESRLQAALAGARPSVVLLTPPHGKALDAASVLPLIDIAQASDVAVMLADDAQLVRTTRADGVHLRWSNDISARAAEAREILGNHFMLGVDVGHSRHDAMVIGEAGADYIAFGISEHAEDREAARALRAELCHWWGEVFEVPCVAFNVESAVEAEALAAMGADFVAVRLPPAAASDDLRLFVSDLAQRLATIADAA